jgi:hypothetical protein
MAYMNQEKKAVIKAALDKALKGSGVKFSLSVDNHSSIVCTIKSAPIDLIANMNDVCRVAPGANRYGPYQDSKDHVQVNPYWYKEHFSGKSLDIVDKIVKSMYSAGYYNNSDAMTDYFDCAYYIHVNIGKWNKPFEVK